MESKHGSLGRGMVEARKKKGTAAASPLRPVFTSLKEGMQQIVDALVARLDAYALKMSSRVQAVIREHDGWYLLAGFQSARFDTVLIATPPHTAAVLLSTDESVSRRQG